MKYHKEYIQAMLDNESHLMSQATINKLRNQLKQEDPTMSNEIKIIDDVISSLYDDYEQEQAYAQKVISAWIKIKNKLKESDNGE